MSAEPEVYMNGKPGPLTREIPECMREKYTVVQSIIDVIVFVIVGIGNIIKAIYRTIVGYKNKDLKGGIALVTGGGGGLGSLIALRLSRLGCTIVLWDINAQGLEDTVKLVKGIGGTCHGYVVDLANREEIYRVAKLVEKEVGRVTLLINNAGVVSGKYLLDTPDHLIQRTFDVNVLAHFWTVKAFLPAMIEHNDGHIVTIASMAGHIGVPKLVDYCSSKAAACGLDESLRSELDVQGINGVHTSLICPFFIRATGMFEEVNSRLVPQLNPNEVADRVVQAIRTNEAIALIPGIFRILLPMRWIFPWKVIADFVQVIVPDAAPLPMPAAPPVTTSAPKLTPIPIKSESTPITFTPPERHDRKVR